MSWFATIPSGLKLHGLHDELHCIVDDPTDRSIQAFFTSREANFSPPWPFGCRVNYPEQCELRLNLLEH